MKKTGVIYGVFDSEGRCRYVGATIRKLEYREREHVKKSLSGSKIPIARAIRKWGGVTLTPLIQGISANEIGLYEYTMIGLFRSVGDADLNLLTGGYRSDEYISFKKTEDQRKRQSEISKANWADPEWASSQRAKIRRALQEPDKREAARQRALKRVSEGSFGASRKGSKSGHVKLNEESVLSIREQYAKGDTTYKTLGILHGVTESCIHRIINRKSWTHV